MHDLPSFLLPSRLHLPSTTRAAVVLGGAAMTIAHVGADSQPVASALAFTAAALLALTISRAAAARLGCAGLVLTVVVAVAFCVVSYLGRGGVIDPRAGCTGGGGEGNWTALVVEAVLAASLIAVVFPARARCGRETIGGADARATALGLWLAAAGATGLAAAASREPVTLYCEAGVVRDLECWPNAYQEGTLNCVRPVPLRPLAEIAGGSTLLSGIAIAAIAMGRRTRRWVWMRRAERGDIAGAKVLAGRGSVAFEAPGYRPAHREAGRPELVVVVDEPRRPRPVLVLATHMLVAAAGVLLLAAVGFMAVMAGEGARYEERYRTVPSVR